MHFQAVRNPAQVHTAHVASYLSADTAGAELVGNWGLWLESKFNAATLATSIEFPKGWDECSERDEEVMVLTLGMYVHGHIEG